MPAVAVASLSQPARVSGRWNANTGRERGSAGLLCLDDPSGSAVDVEHVVDEAVALLQRELTDRDAAMPRDVRGGRIADDPAGLRQQAIDLFAGGLLGFRHLNVSRGREIPNITRFRHDIGNWVQCGSKDTSLY
jgi:hypothetical protein